MAGNLFKNIHSITEVFRFLTIRCYSKPATVHKINLNRRVGLDGDTLQAQFLKYMGISNAKDYNTEKSKIKYSEFFPITDPKLLKRNISEVEIADFPTLINFLYTYNTRAPANNVLSCISLIERETCAKLDIMDAKTIFNILFAYMFMMPGYTNQLRFYFNAMMKLNDQIDSLSKEHLVQYGFYLGISKTSNPEFANIFNNILLILTDKYLEQMTIDELCIITNAAFKMSVKINSLDMLDNISKTLINQMSEKKLEIGRIITLLKSLRLSRYFNISLLQSLTQYLQNESNELNVTAISHILPYYADNNYLEESTIKQLVEKFLNQVTIEKSCIDINESNNVRAKDLTRFLWALSYLNWTMDHKTLEKCENIILDKFTNGDYRNNMDDLFNSSLSFCTMNYVPKRLLRLILTERFIKLKSNTSRSEERKRLLLSILKMEYSEAYEEMPYLIDHWNSMKDLYTDPMTSNRKNLQRVLNILRTSDMDLNNIRLECQIPFLNTAGIRAEINNKIINIEVLDDGLCFRNMSTKLNGVMELKLRLLKSLPQNATILVEKEAVENQDEENIAAYLKEQLSKFL